MHNGFKTTFDQDAATVRQLADRCFRQGRAAAGDPEGDARRLESELPANLGAPSLNKWMDEQGLNPDRYYRQDFRKVALMLKMAATHRAGRGK